MPALLKPLHGSPVITQRFGENPEWYPLTKGHNGVDWGIPEGTLIYAAASGLVTVAGPDTTGYGTHIRIQSKDCLCIYGHLSQLAVKRDDQVTAGQVIGYSGNTGNSTGPHLHFEVRLGSTVYTGADPMLFFVDSLVSSVNPPLFKVKTIVPGLRLRVSPNTKAAIIREMAEGTELNVIDFASDFWLRAEEGCFAGRMNAEDYVKILEWISLPR